MTQAPPGDDDRRDGIDVGKRLVRQGGGTGLSLSERVAERLQRMTWRTPLHGLRLTGRHPLKLIAVADDPFLGDLARGQALLDGDLMFRGERVAIDRLALDRPRFSAAFAEHLHGGTWLRDLSSVAPRVVAVPIAEALMREWLAAHGDTVAEPAWRADLCGRRMLSWILHAPLILSSADLVYRSRVLNTIARAARHLDGEAGRAPAGIRAITAWAGVVAAGLVVPGGDPRRAFGEAGLTRALTAGLYDDGGSIGRSPAEQLDIVMTLTALRDLYGARRLEPPDILGATLTGMVAALMGVCHGDGGLSCWQGSGPVTGDRIADVISATGVRTRPLRHAGDWGYQRLAAGRTIVIVDAAPPPMARAARGGGCASTLAFELSDGGQRIVVNCGGAADALLTLPAELRRALRTTAAHSTLVLADTNSTAVNPDGSLGKGVTAVDLSRQETEAISRIEASHDGYAKRVGFHHRRVLTLSADGRDVQGEDMLIPAGNRGRRGDTTFVARFHLAPGVEIAPTADGQAAFLRIAGGAVWQFRCKGATLGVEESLWIDPAGMPVSTFQLVLSGTTPAGGHDFSWRFHRAR